MSTYKRYQQARDTAWRALLCLETKRLPVDAEALARQMGVEVLPYPDAGEEPRLSALLQAAGGGKCVSLRIRGAWHIFLRREGLDGSGRRYAVAHELGHLLLSHETYRLAPGAWAFCSRENAGDLLEDPESVEDYAADIFAIRLLAPACLLHEMHVDTPASVTRLCGLPPRAAALRAERMELLNQRDAFFSHPLERQVRDAFLPYLREKGLAGQPPGSAADSHPAPPVPDAPLESPGKGGGKPEHLQPVRRPPPAVTEKPAAKAWGWAVCAAAAGLALLLFFLLR